MRPNEALFVAWQSPTSREFLPVGRFACRGGGGDLTYEFRYVKGAEAALRQGFQLFHAFPEFARAYVSDELFPFLANRVLPESREDYPEYVRNLGLDPATATPVEILARSGGRRATDSLELFAGPRHNLETRSYEALFLVHGLRYMPPASQDRALALARGDRLFIAHDLQNPVDPSALLLRTDDYAAMGFMPRYFLSDAWQLVRSKPCELIEIRVEQVNARPAPAAHRLLCLLRGRWPDGLEVCGGEMYQPVDADAEIPVSS